MIETVNELLKTVKAERADNEPTLSNWFNLCHESIPPNTTTWDP